MKRHTVITQNDEGKTIYKETFSSEKEAEKKYKIIVEQLQIYTRIKPIMIIRYKNKQIIDIEQIG